MTNNALQCIVKIGTKIGKYNITQIIDNMDDAMKDKLRFGDLKLYIQYIEKQYNVLQERIEGYENQRCTIIEFCEKFLKNNTLIQYMMNIQNILTSKNNNLFSSTLNLFKNTDKDYIMRLFLVPPEEVYLELFYDCFMAQMKGFVVMEFSYYYLRLYGKGSFQNEINQLRKQNKKWYKEFSEVFLRFTQEFGHYQIWNATISNWEKQSQTYDAITRLLQGFIQNEEALHDDKSCWKTCESFTKVTFRSYKGTKCDRKGCKGEIYDCKFVSDVLKICPSNFNSLRRYETINEMGRNSLCPSNPCSINNYWSFLVKCDYCFCICDGADEFSDRYISLDPVFSDTTVNKVVTGIRLVKKNRIFFLKIQEGILGPYGVISNRNWVPVMYFKINQRNILKDVNYTTLTYDNRSLHLNTIILKDNLTVTGVKFVLRDGQIQLNVLGTKYDVRNGTLINNNGQWFSSDKSKEELILQSPDVPIHDIFTFGNNKSLLRLRTDNGNNFIKFTHTDIEKDLAQTTIPYIDIREVTSTNGLLQGVGLMHKGNKGFGGFIAPLLINTSPYKMVQQYFRDFEEE
ncbi:uncharacterized protein LOC109609281 [Aethina tumida]|uniref:uncharacterized protein LOC109609281 n=1 Tax=Aethina tumida TaxID=116153 RepID=UPI002147F5AF|nr:uncharacterized protein LOC109609281 [Aethina tumida]